MKLSHKTLIFFAGFVWLLIGISLLSLGLHFILETVRNPAITYIPGKFSITNVLAPFVSNKNQATLFVITLSLIIGYFKGKMVLAKSVDRQIRRIAALPNPASLTLLYSRGYYLLIILMISLGITLRFFPITIDTRGAIDVAIGAALINGALLYFRKVTQPVYLKKKDL